MAAALVKGSERRNLGQTEDFLPLPGNSDCPTSTAKPTLAKSIHCRQFFAGRTSFPCTNIPRLSGTKWKQGSVEHEYGCHWFSKSANWFFAFRLYMWKFAVFDSSPIPSSCLVFLDWLPRIMFSFCKSIDPSFWEVWSLRRLIWRRWGRFLLLVNWRV